MVPCVLNGEIQAIKLKLATDGWIGLQCDVGCAFYFPTDSTLNKERELKMRCVRHEKGVSGVEYQLGEQPPWVNPRHLQPSPGLTCPRVGLMVGQRPQRCPTIKPTLGWPRHQTNPWKRYSLSTRRESARNPGCSLLSTEYFNCRPDKVAANFDPVSFVSHKSNR